MTNFEIRDVILDSDQVRVWSETDRLLHDWPVVYTLDGEGRIYVGESVNVAKRFRQHLGSSAKSGLTTARVVVDDTFNKSVCLDLESFLIRRLAGEAHFSVLNGNAGITNANYYRREAYQAKFGAIFEALRADGIFRQSAKEIENSALFKLSPFKALSEDQLHVVVDVLEGLFDDIAEGLGSSIVVQGSPGTGKTVVAIFLIKLLRDIEAWGASAPIPEAAVLEDFFTDESQLALTKFRVGLVVPQQSLRKSIQRVFDKTPGLDAGMVCSPFNVGEDPGHFDLLVVDEAHRLTQRASQGSGFQNKRYSDITTRLFGEDDKTKTQLDWIAKKSTHQMFLIDREQSVRPADVPSHLVEALLGATTANKRRYRLKAQHRVRAGSDYVGYVRNVLAGVDMPALDFGEYDLRFYDDFAQMRGDIRDKDHDVGLARLVAGYAWKWASKKDRTAFDISIDGEQLQWNTQEIDWVSSKTSVDEMGSIHTIQGYDLNYAGVVIGPDLRYNLDTERIEFARANYYDTNGKMNNNQLGLVYTDDQLLGYVRNIYAVLMTRGIMGTFVYVCDPPLRERLRPYFGSQ
ncbi:DUF2075 domain-containing protein [Ornithinimicrobium sp. Arc0846-15]|nr:DUF2075 domain-containing protein [Ornithinimicrobium laminariae]